MPENLGTAVLELTADDTKLKTDIDKAHKTVGQKMQSMGKTVMKAGGIMTAALTAPIVAGGKSLVDQAINTESAFAGVIKTVDGLVDSEGELTSAGEDLKQQFMDLSTEIPVDMAELMGIGEMSGQLGVGREHLLSFTRTMADMRASTNLTGEEAATQFARLANIMGTAEEDYERMGSSVVFLGNNYATTEKDIVAMAGRMAASGKLAGMTESDLYGVSAALSSVGITSEVGGTAVQKAFGTITEAVAAGGAELDILAKTSGTTSEDFVEMWEADAAQAFTGFVEGLGEQGRDASGTLEMLELGNERTKRAFLSLAGGGDILRDAIGDSNVAWEENVALAEEAEQRYGPTESKIQMVKNQVIALAVGFGELLLPLLQDTLAVITPFIERLGNLSDEKKKLILKVLALVAAAGPLIFILGAVVTALGAILSPIGLVVVGIGALIAIFVKANGGIQGTADKLTYFANWLTTNVWPMIQSALNLITGFFQEKFGFIRDWIDENMGLIQATFETVMPILKRIWTITWGAIQVSLQTTWELIKGTINVALALITGILKAAMQVIQGDWSGAWTTIKATATNIFNAIFTMITNILRNILSRFNIDLDLTWQAVSKWFTMMWQTISNIISTIRDFVTSEVGTTRDNVTSIFDNMREVVEGIWNALKAAGEAIWNALKTAIIVIVGLLLAIITGDWESAAAIISGIWTALKETAASIWESMKATAVELWTAIRDQAVELAEDLQSTVEDTISALRDALPEIWEAMKTFAVETWESLKEGIIEKAEEVVDSVGEMLESAKTAISEFSLKSVGGALIDGLIGGIVGKAQSVADAAAKVVRDAIAAARKAVGANSPAKEGIELGQDIMGGLAMGLGDLALDVEASMVVPVVQGLEGVNDLAGSGGTTRENHYNITVPQPIGNIGDLRNTLRLLEMATA